VFKLDATVELVFTVCFNDGAALVRPLAAAGKIEIPITKSPLR
jgi:hypothetical protein